MLLKVAAADGVPSIFLVVELNANQVGPFEILTDVTGTLADERSMEYATDCFAELLTVGVRLGIDIPPLVPPPALSPPPPPPQEKVAKAKEEQTRSLIFFASNLKFSSAPL
jgi:hypothetical protein